MKFEFSRPLSAEARVECQVIYMKFVVEKVRVGQDFLLVLRFSPVSIILLAIYIN